ncbi:MAG: alpha/beta hydrolase [Pseudomonadales bacterium]
MTAQELAFEIGDMRYAAKAWGDPNSLPVLALHGWLDNAASFDVLAPMLADSYIVAPDMAGHGQTSHRPYSGSYNIWDDLHDLLSIADACGWPRFTLLGHSRGAIVALLLAVAAPERISAAVLLDGFLPPPSSVEQTVTQLRKHVSDFRKYSHQSSSFIHPSIAAAVEARLRQMPMPKDAAQRIVERSLQQVDGGYVWRYDERLKAASALKLCAGNIENILAELTVPTLLLLAEHGISERAGLKSTLQTASGVRQVMLPGMHHFHMETEPARQIAGQVSYFLKSATP